MSRNKPTEVFGVLMGNNDRPCDHAQAHWMATPSCGRFRCWEMVPGGQMLHDVIPDEGLDAPIDKRLSNQWLCAGHRRNDLSHWSMGTDAPVIPQEPSESRNVKAEVCGGRRGSSSPIVTPRRTRPEGEDGAHM
jgi:hypothetical protein